MLSMPLMRMSPGFWMPAPRPAFLCAHPLPTVRRAGTPLSIDSRGVYAAHRNADREVLVNRPMISWLTTMLVPAFGASNAHAQVRRSAPDGAGGPPRGEAPKGIPRNPQHPYAGVWDGTFTLR